MASSHPSHSAPASLGEPRQRAAATSDAAHGTSPLLPALAGERRFIQHQGRKLALYLSMPQANPGNRNLTPLLLLHTISAAASAAEVKPVFDLYAHKRPVIALELPGFGSSDRSRIVYTPALMSDAITHTLEHIRQGGPRSSPRFGHMGSAEIRPTQQRRFDRRTSQHLPLPEPRE